MTNSSFLTAILSLSFFNIQREDELAKAPVIFVVKVKDTHSARQKIEKNKGKPQKI